MKSLLPLLFVFLIAFSCHNVKEAPALSEQHGGILRINMPYLPKTLFPPGVNDVVASQLVSQIHAGLVKFGASNTAIFPSVARRWKIDSTESIFTFTLRNNAFFCNNPCFKDGKGRKIVAEDVKFSLELLCFQNMDNNNFNLVSNIKGAKKHFEESACSKPEKGVEGIKVLNDSTIEISLEKPNPMFLNFLANPVCAIQAKEAIEKYGTANLIGAGSFTATEMPAPGKMMVLKRSENYFLQNNQNKPLPMLDEIHISFTESASKEIINFMNGELDLIIGLSQCEAQGIAEKYIEGLKMKPPKYILNSVPDSNVHLFNLQYPYVKDFYTNSMNYLDLSIVYFNKTDSLVKK